MNRIDALFEKLKEGRRKAFVAYIVAGDPDLNRTAELILELEKAGVDIVELGVPFSDPLADGVVNQLGAQRALDAGTTLPAIFDMVEELRKKTSIPIVFFTYLNPIFHYGLPAFLKRGEEAGVDGVLILDLPPEEAINEWPGDSNLKRISLIAPTTPPERVQKIATAASGFIYYVSREGVTGMQKAVATNIGENITRIREATGLPVCVGFGISSPEQASQVAHLADGVVVGSAIVDRIGSWGGDSDLVSKIGAFVSPLTEAVHQS